MEFKEFWHVFIPLFVALDGIGLLPLFWSMVGRLETSQRRRAAQEAVLTALIASMTFLLVSRFVFALMGLTLADVTVAGGAILIVLCLKELIWGETQPAIERPSPGVVPLGVPLLAGPAVLTTVLLVRDRYGWELTLLCLFANMLAVWVMLQLAEMLMRLLGREGADVISKVSSLVLTAFGVMLIRHGMTLMLTKSPAGGP